MTVVQVGQSLISRCCRISGKNRFARLIGHTD